MSNGINQARASAESPPSYSSLDSSIETDVALLGTGIGVLSAALKLIKNGRRVTVVASGALHNSAEALPAGYHSVSDPATPSAWYERLGQRDAALVASTYRESISALESIAAQIPECRFELIPAYRVAACADGLMAIERECATGKALRNECWFSHDVPLPFPCAGATRFDHHCSLDVGVLIRALASEFVMLGGEIYEHSPCVVPPQFGGANRIVTEHGAVTASAVLLGSRIPSSSLTSLFAGMTPVHSYFLAAEVAEPMDEGSFVIDEQPRHVIWRANRHAPTKIVICADYDGEDTSRQHLRFDELSCFAASHFSVKKVEARWSQHRLELPSRLPLLVTVPNTTSVFALAGLGALEIPWGAICGEAAADLIIGTSSPLTDFLASLAAPAIAQVAPPPEYRLQVLDQSFDSANHGVAPGKAASGRTPTGLSSDFPEFRWGGNSQSLNSIHRYQADHAWPARSF